MANVSHDLRSPLASLQGYVETLLLKNDQLSDQQRLEYLNTVIKQCQRLANLTVELADLAKLESGQTRLSIETFSFIELAYDCVQAFELAAKKKGISLQLNDESTYSFVDADISLIHRVLQNLIDNALEHTQAGGEVVVNIKQSGDELYVDVSDTGVGISSEQVAYVFDRHYQVNPQNNREQLNSGLGLSIVKRILELHHVEVSVSSQLNHGTSFSFYFPLSQLVSLEARA